MQQLKLQVSQNFYDKLAKGLKKGIILPNGGSYKNVKVGDKIEVSSNDFASGTLVMKVRNLYYFETVLEALDMMGKQKLGYPSKLTSTQIEDKLLAVYGPKWILANGVLVLDVGKK